MTGLHEAQGIYRDWMASSTHVRRVLVLSLRLRVCRCGSTMCTTARLHQFSQLLARRKAFEEIRSCVHDWSHQSQSLHEYQDLGKKQHFFVIFKVFWFKFKKKLHKNIVLLILLIIFITIESVLLLLNYGCICVKLNFYVII